CVFFFQAEDGIRDFHVTGVQTCALPIYSQSSTVSRSSESVPVLSKQAAFTRASEARKSPLRATMPRRARAARPPHTATGVARPRSEERRVGKEWRTRRAADRQNERAARV